MSETPAMYAIVIEHLVDGGWRPLTEPWTQAFDRSPDEIAALVAESWSLDDLGRPWAVGVFKGIRFEEKLADLRSV